METTVIYGTGGAAQQLLANHRERLGSVCFASSDGGGTFMGSSVMGLNELAASGLTRIIIASTYLNAILTSLQAHGIPLDRIAWYYHEEDRILEADEIGINSLDASHVIYAFYDLAMNPSTYDAAVFAQRAEVHRRRLCKSAIHFIIVPSLIQGGRPGDVMRYGGVEEAHWRQQYIVAALFKLIPSCRGVSVLACREEIFSYLECVGERFPVNYDPFNPQDEHITHLLFDECKEVGDARAFVAPQKALRQIREMVERISCGRKLVTLTLREYDYQARRNSDMNEWRRFISQLDFERFVVCVVRDTSDAMLGLPPEWDFDENQVFTSALPSVDVNYRMALYELAYLNLTISNGPSTLLYFAKNTRYLMFKCWLPDYSVTSAEFHRTRNGFEVGTKFPLAGFAQKWVWEPDTYDTIKYEFDLMVEEIKRAMGDS